MTRKTALMALLTTSAIFIDVAQGNFGKQD